jgi:diguanylate cyclase (GGDEF)-like protein/PAS domain S-box-containing protein
VADPVLGAGQPYVGDAGGFPMSGLVAVPLAGRIRAGDDSFAADMIAEAERFAELGLWSADLRSGYIYVSEGLQKMGELPTGWTSETSFGWVYHEDQPAVSDYFAGLLTAPSRAEIEFRAGWLGDRSFRVRTTSVADASGAVAWLHGVVRETTAPRALEQRVSQDRRLFGDAQRIARIGTWEWNTETNAVTWSTTLYELLGVEPGTPVDFDTYLGMVHPDDRARFAEICRGLARTGRPMEVEHRLLLADGRRKVFVAHGASLNPNGGGTIMIGTAQDVTEQRSTETRMMRSSQRFSDLVAIAPVGIGLFDDYERLVDANQALCELLGRDVEELRGTTSAELTHPTDRSEPLLAGRSATGREVRTGQRVLVTSTGKPVYCELAITMSVADDGQRFWLVVFSDVTERRRTAERLRYQVTHDELTGLPGRVAVNELLAKLLGGPEYESVAVLFCDVDNFKRVNDSLGHEVGDELLVALARRLERGLPPCCTPARMSGDEFVVICSDVAEVGGVEVLANRIAGLLRAAVPVRGQLLRVSAAIGAAVPSGADTTGADLLRFADAAMFDAKTRGTGRVALANAALIASANSQMLLEGQLRDAIANDGLVLNYQPVVAADGTIVSAEALVRWPHPERGMLGPGEFLPVAEQGDLLRDLDRWVLRTALREAADWPMIAGGVLGRPVSVAVNLAGLVPGDPEFVDSVSATVAETGIDWDQVVLELVETSLIDLPKRSRKAMVGLAERGVRFAVDDFGTGYSSLSRLKELPAQIIKIDRAFVSGVADEAADFAVVRALVDMARAMGRTCVAEGVETESQFHVLRSFGLEAYQGWLLSKAIPAEEFRELLKNGALHIPEGY